MINVRAIAIVSATVRTIIVAFAGIGIGTVLCLFYLLDSYTNGLNKEKDGISVVAGCSLLQSDDE